MAEKGDDDDNPYSFKKFMKKSSDKSNNRQTSNATNANETEEDSSSVDLIHNATPHRQSQTQTQRETSSQTSVSGSDVAGTSTCSSESSTERKKTRKEDENPFSFRRFLENGDERRGQPSGLDLANDLPDFVQDQRKHERSRQEQYLFEPLPEMGLPDFAPSAEQRTKSRDFSSWDTPRHSAGQERARVGVPVQESADIAKDVQEPMHRPLKCSELPDFLSPGALTADSAARDQLEDSLEPTWCHVENDVRPVENVIEENLRLKQRLKEMEDARRLDTIKISELEHDLAAARGRESEDTRDLEIAIKQVEKNLQTATERALRAESTVASQKQEIKFLQKELRAERTQSELLQGSQNGHLLSKIRGASEQINVGCDSAEQMLRQLLQGVNSLRLVSDTLSSMGKVSDVSPSDDNPPDSESHEPMGASGGASSSSRTKGVD